MVAKTKKPMLGQDDVIQQGDTQQAPGIPQAACSPAVLGGGAGTARGMVVRDDQRGGSAVEGRGENLARMH